MSFKIVLKIFRLFETNSPFKFKKSAELLGISESTPYIINKISNYLFGTQIGNNLREEKFFDINLDYQYYYADFYKIGIDLNKENIDWWAFNSILNSILLDEFSTMHKIISYRTYEKPSKNIKVQEEKEHKFRMKMKRKYALPNVQSSNNALQKLWSYVEKKVGEKKE